jgi:acyl-CoA synthetase (AMP-forming)/AMP-acid ligase II
VYPEEVEVVARSMPGIVDCNAVGAPDTRFGEIVVLVASRAPGATVSDQDVIDHVRAHLAPYKAPRRVVWVDSVYRSPSGKADYRWARQQAASD